MRVDVARGVAVEGGGVQVGRGGGEVAVGVGVAVGGGEDVTEGATRWGTAVGRGRVAAGEVATGAGFCSGAGRGRVAEGAGAAGRS
jgi:hypothetical protein